MRKVLIFSPRFPPQSGGSAIYFSTLVQKLSDQYDFTIVTYRNNSSDSSFDGSDATVYRMIPRFKSLPSFVRGIIESTVSFLIATYVIAKGYELAHVHATSFATPGVSLATVLFDVPIVYDCRDELFPPWLVKVGRTPAWFSCTPNVDAILETNGIPESQIVRTPVVNPPHVADHTNPSPKGPTDGDFDIVYAGRLVEEKGVPLLLEAFEAFLETHPDAHLTLIGDDPTGSITRMITDRSLSSEVTAEGQLQHRDTIELIAASDVLVLPSYSEGLPRVVIEAFELGIPVVATPVGAVPDVIDDGETGLLVDHKISAIVTALEQLYENESFRREIAQNAMKEIENRTWDRVVERVSATYDDV